MGTGISRTAVGVVLLCLALAGCGGQASAGAARGAPATARPSPTATATPPPTYVVMPTATTPSRSAANTGCNPDNAPQDLLTQMAQFGDLLISVPKLSGLAYPSFKLPENTPLAPFQVQAGSDASNQPALEPMTVNPNLREPDGGYQIAVCNVSKTSRHTVQGVSAQISTIAAYRGQLNQWNVCDGPYYTSTGTAGGGCGGGTTFDEALHVTFPAGGGTQAPVSAVQTGSGGSPGPGGASFGPLPVTLAPGQGFVLNIGLTPPTVAGTYTFAFAVTADGATLPYMQATPNVLLAPIAHTWSGQACQSATMKSQIPSTPNAAYVCPESGS